MTRKMVAEKMLHDHGIFLMFRLFLPRTTNRPLQPSYKTVNLSEGVYGSNSVAAAAIAAHECGHAVQHATAYAPLTLRSETGAGG